MMRVLVACLAIFSLCVAADAVRAAEDLAQPGTKWVGVRKTADPKDKGKKKGKIKYTSTEFELHIKTRDGKEFTGETRQGKGNDVRIKGVAGTIDDKGVADFRVTERLKGAKADDIVDNARHHGTFKGEQFVGYFLIPGNDVRGGEIELKLEKPEKK